MRVAHDFYLQKQHLADRWLVAEMAFLLALKYWDAPMQMKPRLCICAHVSACDGLNEKRCESEWCPLFWILISSSDISGVTLPPPPRPPSSLRLLLSTSAHSVSSHPLPTSVLSLSSICIRNRIWGTMLSYHRSESEKEWVRKKDSERVPSGGQETEKLRENGREEKRQQLFLPLSLHPSLVSNTRLAKHHGPNWTNDCAQIRPTLMNKWMRK